MSVPDQYYLSLFVSLTAQDTNMHTLSLALRVSDISVSDQRYLSLFVSLTAQDTNMHTLSLALRVSDISVPDQRYLSLFVSLTAQDTNIPAIQSVFAVSRTASLLPLTCHLRWATEGCRVVSHCPLAPGPPDPCPPAQ
jgi:hypothetical protein